MQSKHNLLRGAASLALMVAAAIPVLPASAQDTLDEIVVTGSRIRQSPLTQTQPVIQVDSEAMARTGLSSTAEILQRLPISGGGLNSKFNNSGNFGNPPDGGGVGAGAAEVDLRYLGSRRTLVLVDGLRWVNGASASGIPSSTDLNTIPKGIIDRIEVLQEGASSIYGSDAISGVVNIITKKKQDGFTGSAQVGAFDEGDGVTQEYDLSWGASSGGTSIVADVTYVKVEDVMSGDRSISQFPTPGVTACDSSCSSGTPLGRFIVNNPVTGAGMNLTLKQAVLTGKPVFNPLAPTAGSFKDFTTADRFNFQPYNYIQAPSERIGTFFTVTQEITPDINFRLKAVYNNRKSANQAAPIPLFVGPDAGNGNMLDRISIDVTNPYNPFGVTLSSGGANGPANYAFIGRRFVEAGPRHYEQEVNTWYVSGTLDGSLMLGENKWYWDVNTIFSRNSATQKFTGNVNAQRLAQALGPVSGCTAPCVPFNIFGGAGSITQQQMDYVLFTQQDSSKQRLGDASVNLSGDLFQMPAGGVGVALGYEYRDQRGEFQPDAVVAAGLGSDIPALPSKGSFDVNEAYGELRVPLLADLPVAKLLEVSGAVRYSDYSTFGSETTYSGRVNWRVTDDVLLRGSYGQGFRAPGIGELFGTPSRFDQELVDPCSDMLGLSGGTAASAAIRANCIAHGVPANGSYVQANPQLSVVTGGNDELQPETSESWVFGGVFSPSWEMDWADRLDFEVNYYDIKLKNAIQPIGAETILGRCEQNNDAFSCASVTRTASGAINQITGLLQNIGAIDTDGIDFTINWQGPASDIGTFRLSLNQTFLLNYAETVPATNGSTKIDREGTEKGSPDQAFPKYKATAILDWAKDDFSASLTNRYVKSVEESQADNKLNARLYTDVQVSWFPAMFENKVGLTLGVNNLFDKDPPACFSCGLNNFDPTTYDAPGQFGYARLTYKM
ncbi:TonB-dependent receptor domain-containing protein [Niveispirillum sp. KHB5.9]|uniref:TonB-dependent receptor domain-containing protein n=1 Tax=Niveispirillum sp. KHB5.9 TaxID=3400269 RepID=UPI003A846383